METLRFFIVALFVLFITTNSTAQDKDKYIKLLEEKVESLKKERTTLTDSISQKDIRINTLQSTNQVLLTDRNTWESKAETSEAGNEELRNQMNDYTEKKNIVIALNNEITSKEGEIEELEQKLDGINKSTLKKQLSDEVAKSKGLEQELANKIKEVKKLEEVKNDYTLLKTEKNDWQELKRTNDLKIARLERIEKELNDDLKEKSDALTVFTEFKEEAIKTVRVEIPKLVASNQFYDSRKDIEDYEKKLAMIKTVVGNNDMELNQLSDQLTVFKNAAQLLQGAKSVLEEAYNSTKVNNIKNKLSQFSGNTSTHFTTEKNKLIFLLQNYCQAYEETYSLFKGFENYNGKSGQEELVIKYIGYFRIFNLKVGENLFINIYEEYPFLHKKVDKRGKNPTNNSITLSNTPCN